MFIVDAVDVDLYNAYVFLSVLVGLLLGVVAWVVFLICVQIVCVGVLLIGDLLIFLFIYFYFSSKTPTTMSLLILEPK